MNQQALQALNQATGNGKSSTTTVRLIDACVLSGLVESNGEAKKAITAKSIYLNEQLVTDLSCELTPQDFIAGKLALLRKGKKTYGSLLLDK